MPPIVQCLSESVNIIVPKEFAQEFFGELTSVIVFVAPNYTNPITDLKCFGGLNYFIVNKC